MSCDARIRPFPARLGQPDREVACEEAGSHRSHAGVLRDYAYPGSKTVLHWEDDDRRNYRGDWPGACGRTPGCVLPAGHPRDCAQ